MTRLLRTTMFVVFMMSCASSFALEPVKYIDANGQEQYVTDYTVLECSDTEYSSSTINLSDGWYVLYQNLDDVRVNLKYGDVHLILADNSSLTVDWLDIDTKSQYSTSFHVYSQSLGDNMGKLILEEIYKYDYLKKWEFNGGQTIVKDSFSGYTAFACLTFVMNGGSLSFENYIKNPIGCKDMFLNGGTIKATNADAAVTVGQKITFGHSYCDFVGEFSRFGYYGDDDICLSDGIIVKMNDKEYRNTIPSTATDNEKVRKLTVTYDPVAAAVNSLEVNPVEDNNWFTIDGVALNSKPERKGIYLNGKKKIYIK